MKQEQVSSTEQVVRLLNRIWIVDGELQSKTLSVRLDIAVRTIERELAFLRNNGFITRNGADKNGSWKILK